MTRARSGMYELEQKFPQLGENNQTSSGRTLRIIARTPSMWRDAPIYLGVMMLAKLRAERLLRRGGQLTWQRDDTSRQ